MNYSTCIDLYSNHTLAGKHCNASWDSFLCWPPTFANSTAFQNCPLMLGSDTSNTVKKFCDEDGDWEYELYNEEGNDTIPWTNYTSCFTPETLEILGQIGELGRADYKLMLKIAKIIRMVEITGLWLSFLSLMVCFGIYYKFRSLRNERSTVHMHLFAAVTISVFVKMLLYGDQMRIGVENILPTKKGIDDTPILCEAIQIILEYLKTSMYAWMFIEGLHLHKAVAVTATRMVFKKSYVVFGWGTPFITTAIWVAAMASKTRSHCWYGYIFNPLIWIVEGPRLLMLLTNTIYLVQIVRVLITKLGMDNRTEIQKIRKTLRSTISLLPLLGIPNYLTYFEPSYNTPVWYFTLYMFITYTITSLQGLFIASLYCLMTQEVKDLIISKIGNTSSISSTNTIQQLPIVKKHKCVLELFTESNYCGSEQLTDRLGTM